MSFNLEDFINDVKKLGVERTLQKYRIRRNKFHSICKMFNIEIPPKGRPKSPITQEEIDYIVKYNQSSQVGYITMANIAKRDPSAPKSLTIWRCHLVYEMEDLYQFLHLYRPTDDEDHPNRYVA